MGKICWESDNANKKKAIVQIRPENLKKKITFFSSSCPEFL